MLKPSSLILPMIILVGLSGCAIQNKIENSNNAELAQTRLIGMEKEQILACMGAPLNNASVGETEVWSYYNYEAGSGGTTPNFSCRANVTFTKGKVSNLIYQGDTGGWYSEKEACGTIVQECLK